MASYIEVQCDGLIGATHNYAGLSFGNIASQSHAQNIAYPRRAALQGLEKIRYVNGLGVAQIILPPPLRPNLLLLEQLGLSLTHTNGEEAIQRAAWSASTMWSANAATVSPAPDTHDGALHLTIANLATSLHRAQEASERYTLFRSIFGDIAQIHAPLPACTPFTDEGAANHMRLCPMHGEAGVEIFVYGRDDTGISPTRYPARQTKRACEAVVRLHQLRPSHVIFAQQHPDAIDAGVFHNDVIAMSNEAVMIYHELTFLNEATIVEELRHKTDFPLTLIRLRQDELSIEDAIKSYFYNSQLVSLPEGGMVIIAPSESRENDAARRAFDYLVQANDNPICAIHYLDVRESMQNGGGPACLRLRIVMTQDDYQRIPEPYRFSESRYLALREFISHHYPETFTSQDLHPHMADTMHRIHAQLMQLFT